MSQFIPSTDIAWIDNLAYRPIDEAHVQALVARNEPENWPPIIVTPGAYREGCHYGLIAGQHRLLAALDLECESIAAAIENYTSLDAMYLAMWEDNIRNGRPPTVDERKEHAVMLHAVFPEYSYRELGRMAGLDDKTVKRAIAQAEKEEDEEPNEEQRNYNTSMQKPARSLLIAFIKFVDAESNVFGSKYGDRNTERRARALAKFIQASPENVQLFRSLSVMFTQAAQYTEEKLKAIAGKR